MAELLIYHKFSARSVRVVRSSLMQLGRVVGVIRRHKRAPFEREWEAVSIPEMTSFGSAHLSPRRQVRARPTQSSQRLITLTSFLKCPNEHDMHAPPALHSLINGIIANRLNDVDGKLARLFMNMHI